MIAHDVAAPDSVGETGLSSVIWVPGNAKIRHALRPQELRPAAIMTRGCAISRGIAVGFLWGLRFPPIENQAIALAVTTVDRFGEIAHSRTSQLSAQIPNDAPNGAVRPSPAPHHFKQTVICYVLIPPDCQMNE